MIIPRMPPAVHGVAALAAVLVVPYYMTTGQAGSAVVMAILGALNARWAWRA
jgi:hypothetical protein